ncbi:MAG: hypothetical protein DMG09_25245 [Acidobacteria bacterium]|nr:MAG: hypothetical protein DMG09_25245 [Acidobacteriota bacterium]
MATSIMIVVLSLAVVGLAAVVYQLVKQNGRILLRLDQLEKKPAAVAQDEPQGLAVGTPVSPFSLPDLSGRTVSLEEFLGRQTLLVYWSPDCGFCALIAPELASLQSDLRKRNVQLLLVSYASAESNLKNEGTPTAYLLDEKGRVAHPLASGADQVLALARETTAGRPKRKGLLRVQPLSESRIERGGLKAGSPAPGFHLPDIRGRTVSLEEYRGRRVLLVFTQPGCGPCDQLAPQLVRLHKEHGENGLAVVVVGRGDIEGNRRKAEQHGFEFPVVVQEKWKLSREYGTFATPVAFLIGEAGLIARNAAVGPDEIVSLAREALG